MSLPPTSNSPVLRTDEKFDFDVFNGVEQVDSSSKRSDGRGNDPTPPIQFHTIREKSNSRERHRAIRSPPLRPLEEQQQDRAQQPPPPLLVDDASLQDHESRGEQSPSHHHSMVSSLSRGVSLRTLLIALMLTATLTTALIALLPLYFSSTEAVEKLGRAYCNSVADSVALTVTSHFNKPMTNSIELANAARFGGWDPYTPDSYLAWANHSIESDGVDSIAFIFFSMPTIMVAFRAPPDNHPVPPGQIAVSSYNFSYVETKFRNRTDMAVLNRTVNPSTVDLRTRAYFPLISQAPSWGLPFIGVAFGTSESVLPCGAPLYLSNGTKVGAVYLRTRLKFLVEYFQNIKLSTSRARILLVHTATGSMIATNNPIDPTVHTENGVTTVATLNDVQDPLLRRTINHMGTASLLTCTTPCEHMIERGLHYDIVLVKTVYAQNGLNLRLMLVVSSSDFLQDVQDSMIGSVIGASVAVLVVLIVSVLAALRIAKPLTQLTRKLIDNAVLEDGNVSDISSSGIAELVDINDAHRRLTVELKKLKSFLPQHVLHVMESASGSSHESSFLTTDDFVLNQQSSSTATGSSAQHRQNPEHGSTTNLGDSKNRRMEEDEGEDAIGSNEDEYDENQQHLEQQEQQQAETANLTARQRRMKGAIHRSLNLSCALATRRVTMIVCNVVGFHGSLKRYGPEKLHALHSNMVGRMVALAKENRGIVDYVIGDHSYVSFNASYSCRQHCTHAALFALGMEKLLQRDNELQALGGLRMGIASGSAVCGHFGCESMKQFSVVGTVVHHAFALMHQCKSDGVSSLMNAAAFDIMHHRFWVLHWNYVLLPQSNNPALISTLKGKRPGLRLANGLKGVSFHSNNNNNNCNSSNPNVTEDQSDHNGDRQAPPISNPLENHPHFHLAKAHFADEVIHSDTEGAAGGRGGGGGGGGSAGSGLTATGPLNSNPSSEEPTNNHTDDTNDDLSPEDSRVLTIVNEAFSEFATGDLEAAEQLSRAVPEHHPFAVGLERALESCGER